MKKVYMDYAATSPCDEAVVRAMRPYWHEKFGNASSVHSWGQEARKAVEESRRKVVRLLQCSKEEVVFTASATEANNLALKGVVEAWKSDNPGKKPHLIVSGVEHHCVLDSGKHLERLGAVLSILKTDKDGLVEVSELKDMIGKNTVVVSVMYGNNEVGTVEPIAEIGRMIKEMRGKSKYPLFHTDAVQAIQYLDCRVRRLGVDMLSASGHKFYGPKGVGFLYVRKGVRLASLLDGGAHEFGMRASTENVTGIVGLGEAVELIGGRKDEVKRLERLRDRLIRGILSKVPGAVLTGHPKQRLPHIASFIIPGVEGEALLLYLDDAGVAASSGSACTSGSLKPSHVLLAMGIKPEEAHGSLRLSLGKGTGEREVDYVVRVLPGIVKKIRRMAPEV